MSEIAVLLIKIATALLAGFFAGHSAVYLLNKIPASWLCDYGEKPGPELTDPYVQRVKGYPWKLVLSGFFAAVGIYLAVRDWQFAIGALAVCWILLMAAIADGKYRIIPDQFVLLLAFCAIGLIPFHESFLQPLWGMLLGGGALLISGLLGSAAVGTETMGFGDVKLMAACGLALGVAGTAVALVIAAVMSGIYFSWGLARKKWKRTDRKPLAPFLAAGAIIYLVILWPLL